MAVLRAPLDRYAGGRLTLTSGTPVTTSDVTGAGTLYYTPYVSDLISLYTGVAWRTYTFSELSLSLSGYTAAKPYDVWLYDNAGTLTLDSTVWTNGTTRATAIARQNGTWTKSGAAARLYLGTIYTSGTGTTEDSGGGVDTVAKRYVWNAYNRRPRAMRCIDSTSSWNYTVATWRQANNNALNQVEFVLGVAEEPVKATVHVRFSNTVAANNSVGIGLDRKDTASDAQVYGMANPAGGNTPGMAFYSGFPAAGFHYMAWMEKSQVAGTTSWVGSSGNAVSGMMAEVFS